MKINKALVTLASPDQRKLPFQTLINREGEEQFVLNIILNEILGIGIEKVGLVIFKADQMKYEEILHDQFSHVTLIPQDEPRGYGHSLYCAKDFLGKDPFLHLVGDHIYIDDRKAFFAKEIIDLAEKNEASISAVQETRESLLPYFGFIGGERTHHKELIKITRVLEKPNPTQAELELNVSGLRSGHYFGFFGIHVFTNEFTETLCTCHEAQLVSGGELMNESLQLLARRGNYYALQMRTSRYNLGKKYGLLKAQIALALNGTDRDEVLNMLLEFLIDRELKMNRE